MRSAQVPISALVAGVQPSAISSNLSNTSNTSLGGCPPGSYPSARWRKYSESDRPHFLANIVTFFFSVKQKDGYCGRSLFINNELDYSRGQTKFTLLEKTKTNLRTGEQILLYRRSTDEK